MGMVTSSAEAEEPTALKGMVLGPAPAPVLPALNRGVALRWCGSMLFGFITVIKMVVV
jgi:hypothetical protein